MEPQVNISFSSSELQALGALLDAAVKATGIQGAKTALPIVAKLEQAVAEANKPKKDTDNG
jgi:predicted component of type VI protein secretion system